MQTQNGENKQARGDARGGNMFEKVSVVGNSGGEASTLACGTSLAYLLYNNTINF